MSIFFIKIICYFNRHICGLFVCYTNKVQFKPFKMYWEQTENQPLIYAYQPPIINYVQRAPLNGTVTQMHVSHK